MLLQADHIEIRYGSVPAVRDVSFQIDDGEIVCFVGPNGAGKSTTTLAIAGVLRPAKGDIVFASRSILGRDSEAIVALGIGLVPEGRRIFTRLTVRENLIVASGLRGGVRQLGDTLERILTLFPVLRSRFESYAGHLSGGEQQQLAIARALLTKPRLLIVDEPSLGLAPKYVDLVFETLKGVRAEGTTLLIVEQSMKRALALADRLYVMRSGRIVLEGSSAELAARGDLEHVYFGGKASA
jgi:branched-chain amino acid transport system ATP-binding protein